ncbi:hypothetical protein TNCV_4156261 [Trichonephila clavipes]|nr:hypothetical protein TNCV_4156261 [Trichonephila clavipes]
MAQNYEDVAQSLHVAEHCDVNIHSLTNLDKLDEFRHQRSRGTTDIPFTHMMSGVSYPKEDGVRGGKTARVGSGLGNRMAWDMSEQP